MAKKKKPKSAFDPSPKKEPRQAVSPDSYHGLNPSWRLSLLELVDPYGWHKVDRETALKVCKRLGDFESMTWSQILVEGQKQHHSVAVEKISKKAKARLQEIGQDDVPSLLSLRVTGAARVWGILEEGVLKILWWDPSHQVCPSKKKHT